MKKVLIVAIVVLAACVMVAAQGHGKPKIAVYVTGGKTADENTAIGTKIVAALVSDGRYTAVERTASFLNEIAKEQAKQRTGAVDESQISKLGKQFGVQFVCVVDITTAFGSNLISARIINVESAEVVSMGKAASPMKTLTDVTNASNQVTKAMLAAPSAKGAKRLAVYVTGAKTKDEGKALGTEILSALVDGGTYRAVERSNAFLAEVDKEQVKQRSGAIDDDQISKLGKQFGVQFVCIANISNVFGSTQVSARIVDVESAEIVAVGETESKLGSLDELTDASARIFGAMAKQLGIKVVTLQYRGKTYKTVDIGGKTWMAENMNYKTGNSWCYDNDESNCQKYGRLYDWNTARQVCSDGWRLPARKDWDDLLTAAGGKDAAGKRLKSKSQWNGTDDYGFSALPGGYRNADGSFYYAGSNGLWWSATEDGSGSAYDRNMDSLNDNVYENDYDKGYGFSARCVR